MKQFELYIPKSKIKIITQLNKHCVALNLVPKVIIWHCTVKSQYLKSIHKSTQIDCNASVWFIDINLEKPFMAGIVRKRSNAL